RAMAGYPIAALSLAWCLPPLVALVVTSCLASGATAATSATLFGGSTGWAVALLVPAWIYYGSIGMSESVLALACMLAVLAQQRGRPLLAACCLGYALWTKLTAVAVVIPLLVVIWLRNRRIGLLAGMIVVGWCVAYLLLAGWSFGSWHASLDAQR